MTGQRPPHWLVAGTTTAVRTGTDTTSLGSAIAANGFTHIAVADADPATIPVARTALDSGVLGLVIFVSPAQSWQIGHPPNITEAYPPNHVRTSVEQVLAGLGRDTADIVLAHKWDPAWPHLDQAMFAEITTTGTAARTGVSCPDSHPGAAHGLATGQIVCASWNVHDQALAAHAPDYHKAGALVLARAPLDHGALTGAWADAGPDDWRTRWWGPLLGEVRRRGNDFATTARTHGLEPGEAALRFTHRDRWPHGTLVGVSNATQAAAIARWFANGPLNPEVREDLAAHAWHHRYT